MKWIKQKYENFRINWKKDSFRKGFSSLIGAIIMTFFMGAVYAISTLAIYQISYIKATGGSIKIEHITYYYPIELLFQCVSSFFSGIIYKKLKLHVTNLLGVTTVIISYYIMYLSNHFALDVLSIIIGGIGTGIMLYPSATNAYEWFPEHNGLIVGILETTISLGSFFWAFLGEKIINNEQIVSDEETNLYPMNIAIKMKLYLIILIIGWLVAYILSFILTFERKNYNPEIQIDIKSEEGNLFSKNSDTDTNTDFDESFLNVDNINIDENVIGNEKNEVNKKKKKRRKSDKRGILDVDLKFEGRPNRYFKVTTIEDNDDEEEISLKYILKFTFKSKRLIFFIVIVTLQSPVSNMAFNLYREIGEYFKVEPKYLQLVGSFEFIFECLSSFVFGVLCDYFKLKNLLIFINIVGTISGFTYCLTFKNGLVFLIFQNFLSFTSGGYYPIKDCYLMKVFGSSIYIELSGLVSFLVALVINLLTPISAAVVSGFKNKETAYWVLFCSFGLLSLIATILNFFLSEQPVDKNEIMGIKNEEKNENEEKKENENEQKEEKIEKLEIEEKEEIIDNEIKEESEEKSENKVEEIKEEKLDTEDKLDKKEIDEDNFKIN